MIEAKVIADSITESGDRITTLQVKFHRFILAEFNTHRVFSRNFSSSRAIPTKKLLEQVRNNPAMPVHWGMNQPGMQAETDLQGRSKQVAVELWRKAAQDAATLAQSMADIGLHKQVVNRIIEPFLWVTGIVTSTEWDNWDQLRRHKDAQPEIHQLACRIHEARSSSVPIELSGGQWHLPYITEGEQHTVYFDNHEHDYTLQKISAARCCRVSYLKHDQTVPSVEEDLALFDRLAGSVPIHASPLEHQASPLYSHKDSHLQGNFKGWIQFRKLFESGTVNK